MMRDQLIELLEEKNQRILDSFDLLSEEEQLNIIMNNYNESFEFLDDPQFRSVLGGLAGGAVFILGSKIIGGLYRWLKSKRSPITREDQVRLVDAMNAIATSKNNTELKKNKNRCIAIVDEFIIKYPTERLFLEQLKTAVSAVKMSDLK
jgi:hypothetical protein